MALFIDSNFFIALINTRDKYYGAASSILSRFNMPEYRNRITSDYVLDEVVTKLSSATNSMEIVEKAYNLITKTPKIVEFVYFDEFIIDNAWKKYQKYTEFPKRPLSFTDCSILSYMDHYKIKNLISFDKEFLGLVNLIKE